jgi:hypothetical protein
MSRGAGFHYQEFRYATGLLIDLIHSENGKRYKHVNDYDELVDIPEKREQITWTISALKQSVSDRFTP